MINRPLYLDRIRPFIGKPIIKVVTGVRRSGKSTLLRLVQAELKNKGVSDDLMLDINLEAVSYTHLDVYKRQCQNPITYGRVLT